MPVHARRTGWVYTTALSWRVLAQRFSFLLFLLFSIGLLFVGQSKPSVLNHLRLQALDSIAPVISILSRPVALIDTAVNRIQSYRSLVAENEKLRNENSALMRWHDMAIATQNENKELKSLLNYKLEPSLSYISARVIGDAGGAFVRSFIVTAGSVDGVREGMAAITGEGLIGRVVEVGDWTSRILLITDVNSRIPVMLMGTSEHAILAGDNMMSPKLLYLPQDTDVKVGTRVMTSGHGGIFPPNLPVGIVSKVQNGSVEVQPLASFGRINQVRLVDFNLAAGAVNPMAAKIQAATPTR